MLVLSGSCLRRSELARVDACQGGVLRVDQWGVTDGESSFGQRNCLSQADLRGEGENQVTYGIEEM